MPQPDDTGPDMSGRAENAQFTMLNRLRREHTRVDVYLVIGTRLQGRIQSFDGRSLLLRTNSGELLLYHHAISSVQPSVGRARPHAPHATQGQELRPRPERAAPKPRTEPVVVTRRRIRIPESPGSGGEPDDKA
jgi:host factor-I protein